MSLFVDPVTLSIPASSGQSMLNIINPTKARFAIKAKLSINTYCNIYPIFGFVEPGNSVQLEITRLSGPPCSEKLAVQFIIVAQDDIDDAQTIFDALEPHGHIVVPITAE